jgi:UDP-2-acetamido-3-amino-2,3-dideoxy-glucuronate N-acetyltransferase
MTEDRRANVRIHPSADVSDRATIGDGTAIWQQSQVREDAIIGAHCMIGKCVYVGAGVIVGDNCKIENHASLHEGVELEDGVFIGPHAVLTNDKLPRAINPDGSLKAQGDWKMGRIFVRYGASVGSGSIVLPDVVIGRFAMVGAGSVVTKNVPAHGLIVGNPAHLVGYVCAMGHRLALKAEGFLECPVCGQQIPISDEQPPPR